MEQLARLRQIERDFHVRAFGEELARVNLDMTMDQRHRYINWMRETALRNGVPMAEKVLLWKMNERAGPRHCGPVCSKAKLRKNNSF
jgi:hypothetical protein